MNNWITPPELYEKLDEEFHFTFDPCPFPRDAGYNSLELSWGTSNYCNPPFRKTNGNKNGPTAFVRKAITENELGRKTVLLLPVQSYIPLLIEAGAELRSMGRVRFLDIETRQSQKDPSPCILAVLK